MTKIKVHDLYHTEQLKPQDMVQVIGGMKMLWFGSWGVGGDVYTGGDEGWGGMVGVGFRW